MKKRVQLKPRVKILDEKLQDADRLSGLYFVIDGTIYIDGTDGGMKHNSHVQFYDSLKRQIPSINERYGSYSYLEFPRGVVMRDPSTGKIMISGPDMEERQVQKILRAFKYHPKAEYKWEYDEHYTIGYILETIKKKLLRRYSEDIVTFEIMEVEEFFTSQLSQL